MFMSFINKQFEKIQKKKVFETDALKYHGSFPNGKFKMHSGKPIGKKELALAYTPGVAEPCKKIAQAPEKVYEYTSKGNTVAVISNGSAVLGLGNIGPEAGKPVMEGKSVLFKMLAGIDSVDLNVNLNDPEQLANFICATEPTFGGINMEDVSAPECFVADKLIRSRVSIPFFHDDQNGTAIVFAAALKNSLYLVKKDISKVKIVVSGAGAAAISCMQFTIQLGASKENIFMFDSKGLLHEGRVLDEYRKPFAQKKDLSFMEALEDADVFVGLSKGNLLQKENLAVMAKDPVILAMANPDPEVLPPFAKSIRPDAIIGTGRSDFPNQVNNVLGFPFLFRGALDVRAKSITMGMQIACSEALMNAARKLSNFGPEQILPDAFDPVLIYQIPEIIAKQAIKDGVAQKDLPENYNKFLDLHLYEDLIENAKLPILGNEAAKDVIRILEAHEFREKSDKKLFVLNDKELISRIAENKSGCLVLNNQLISYGEDISSKITTKDPLGLVDSIFKNGEHLFRFGLLIEDFIFASENNRAWHSAWLCSEFKEF